MWLRGVDKMVIQTVLKILTTGTIKWMLFLFMYTIALLFLNFAMSIVNEKIAYGALIAILVIEMFIELR